MGTRSRITTLRERIDDNDQIDPDDRELLRSFSDRLDLLNQEYSDHRHEKLLRRGVLMAEGVIDPVERVADEVELGVD